VSLLPPYTSLRHLLEVVRRNHVKALLFPITALVVSSKTWIWFQFSDVPDLFLTNDSGNYLKTANDFWVAYFEENRSEVSLLIAPGFSFFVYLLLKVVDINQIPLLLSLLPVFIAIITYRVFRVISKRLAVLSYIYIICEPVLFFESFYLLSDTFFLLLLALMALTISRNLTNGNLLGQIFLGIITGFAILTRPVFFYFPIIVAIYLLFWRRDLVRTFLLSTIIGLGISISWISHNYVDFKVPVVSSVQYKNLILGEVAGIRTLAEGISYREVLRQENELLFDYLGESPSPKDVSSFNTQRFVDVLKDNPAFFVLAHLRGSGMLLFGIGSEAIRNIVGSYSPIVGKIAVVSSGIVTLFVGLYFLAQLFVILINLSRLTHLASFLILFISYFFIVSSGATAYSRFRIPLMLAICIIVFSPRELLVKRRVVNAT